MQTKNVDHVRAIVDVFWKLVLWEGHFSDAGESSGGATVNIIPNSNLLAKALLIVSSTSLAKKPSSCAKLLLLSLNPCIATGRHKDVIWKVRSLLSIVFLPFFFSFVQLLSSLDVIRCLYAKWLKGSPLFLIIFLEFGYRTFIIAFPFLFSSYSSVTNYCWLALCVLT